MTACKHDFRPALGGDFFVFAACRARVSGQEHAVLAAQNEQLKRRPTFDVHARQAADVLRGQNPGISDGALLELLAAGDR